MGGTSCLPVTHIMNYWWESEGTVTERRDLQRYKRTPRAPPTPFLASTSAFRLSARLHMQLFSFTLLRTPFHSSLNELYVVFHCLYQISAELDCSTNIKKTAATRAPRARIVMSGAGSFGRKGRGPHRIQREDLTLLCHSWRWWIIKLEQICHH